MRAAFGVPHSVCRAHVPPSLPMSEFTLTDDILDEILTELVEADAQVVSETDDYGNPYITVGVAGSEYPVIARHSVIGGEQIVGITSAGKIRKLPGPNGDVFGPIDSVPAAVEAAWNKVIAVFPTANCSRPEA